MAYNGIRTPASTLFKMGCSSSTPKPAKYCKPGEYIPPSVNRKSHPQRKRHTAADEQKKRPKSTAERKLRGQGFNGDSVALPKTGFHAKYKPGRMLGEGAFSKVYYCVNKKTGNPYACKIVDKANLPAVDEQSLRSEVDILRSIDSPFIIKCVDFFDEENTIFVVLEFIAGGELFDRITKKTVYNEADARLLVHTILLAIKVCHDMKVVHRDLKPENLLLKSKEDDRDVKLADFGFAAVAENDHCLTDACGTPGYVAPEILQGDLYGRPADMWSIGVITYILLGGYPPFYDDNQKILFRKIKAGSYEFNLPYWKGVSSEAKDLIKNLLVVDPNRRQTVYQALNHPWLRVTDADLAANNLGDQLLEFKKFNARRKFRAAVKAIVTVNKFKKYVTPALNKVGVSKRFIMMQMQAGISSSKGSVLRSTVELLQNQNSCSSMGDMQSEKLGLEIMGESPERSNHKAEMNNILREPTSTDRINL